MNRTKILEKLNNLALDKDQFIVLSGASLVIQGVIEETPDIDLSCSKEYYDKVDWPTKKGAFGCDIKYQDVFEISDNLYYPNNTIKIENFNCLTMQKCLEIKKSLNREKDKYVIEKLEERLK